MSDVALSKLPDLNRRTFLKLTAVLAGASLTGCSEINVGTKSPSTCPPPGTGELIIDMHCHLLNIRDADTKSFVARRTADTDENNRWLNGFVKAMTSLVSLSQYPFVMTATDEYHWLKNNRARLQQDYQEFCTLAAEAQYGLLFASREDQIYGFGSNRTRNAQRLMTLFPQVDIFTPSMVDLGEGNWKSYSSPYELALCYEQIHLTTNGRFLPLVSFSPERAFIERTWGSGKNGERQLELVQRCIETRGFIGVKVHPSSGFAPLNNATYGCPNTGNPGMTLSPERAEFYDRHLRQLFDYCRSVDVPILTHSGTGISANRDCMDSKSTNSPDQWGELLKGMFTTESQTQTSPLRICFAHFAGGFSETGQAHDWLCQAARLIARYEGLYIDLSALAEMFTSDERDIKPIYKQAFLQFLKTHPALAQRMMYGSDWHMPGEAPIGTHYLSTIRSLVPTHLQQSTMGHNAVKFFGLAKGESNRDRLEAFYKANEVPLDNVAWIKKVDGATRKD